MLRILDNRPTIGFSGRWVGNALEEGGSRMVTVTRTGGAGTSLVVHYFTSDGSATAGDDYVPTSGQLLFAVGQTSRTFRVRTRVDESGGTRTVNLNLSVPPGAAQLGPRAPAILRILQRGGS